MVLLIGENVARVEANSLTHNLEEDQRSTKEIQVQRFKKKILCIFPRTSPCCLYLYAQLKSAWEILVPFRYHLSPQIRYYHVSLKSAFSVLSK